MLNTQANPIFMKTFKPITPFFLGICLLMSSCMTSTSLQVLQPAAFALPDYVETIATVNRTRPANKVGNVIEGIFTGETFGQDKSGARRTHEGLTDALTRTPRFNVKFTGIEMVGKGSYAFPEPLPWRTVDSICDQYGANALAVVEKFDSNTGYNTNKTNRESKDKDGKVTRWVEYNTTMRTTVKLGWRLYDPKSRTLLDEFEVRETLDWDGNGRSEAQAKRDLPHQVEAVNAVSYAAGQKYGMRIAPTWIQVSRSYYSKAKGSDQLESDMREAARLARVDRWDDAALIWIRIAAQKDNPKAAGRAAYNLALASEWKGQLELADEWASRSYTEFGNKQAKSYINTLQRRIAEQRRLAEQMGEENEN